MREDASSPTVTSESVLLSCIIDAEEGRDVAVIGIPNVFIQTRVEDEKDMATINHMFVQEDFYQAELDVVAAVMTQLSMKAGLIEWGDKALSAVKSEMKQLHFRNNFRPKHWKDLTAIHRRTVLESHLFLK